MNIEFPSFVEVLDFLGTFAFATSGVRLAANRRYDWFGALIAGAATAIGGGTLRDILLNVTPAWMSNPVYIIWIILAMAFVLRYAKYLLQFNYTIFILDSIGLGLFTVVGFDKAISLGMSTWVAIIMGAITGAGGGVIRDLLLNKTPMIFQKEIYAMACVAGGFVYWGCLEIYLPVYIAQILAGTFVVLLRIATVKYNITLPILPQIDHEP
ncbi:MAG: trimeric intracellular cation channel family protein [Phocaeicola sp.]|nr:trimeric intracellular cation channel family protein [Phocaeicola sp.]MDY3914010.1 trimeric intracellular cation channel family protein [Phocaeicola sp.]